MRKWEENGQRDTKRKMRRAVQANSPHRTVHFLVVLDAPRIRRPGSDDLLPVARFASGGEVLTTPLRLEVKHLVAAGAFKGPLYQAIVSKVVRPSRGERGGNEMRTTWLGLLWSSKPMTVKNQNARLRIQKNQRNRVVVGMER